VNVNTVKVPMVEWQWKAYEQLSTNELYAVLKLRQQVFIVEQNCIYNDIDDVDKLAWHLMGWNVDDPKSPILCAYLRVTGPGVKYEEVAIGRVLSAIPYRGSGVGVEIMTKAIEMIAQEFPRQSMRISAQQHLHNFYAKFGFIRVSEPYDEDGIPHIEMLNKKGHL
jgi:ElaA protein